jgi:hypothetical protein
MTELDKLIYEEEFLAWKNDNEARPLKWPIVPYEIRRARAMAAYKGEELLPLPKVEAIVLWFEQIKPKGWK